MILKKFIRLFSYGVIILGVPLSGYALQDVQSSTYILKVTSDKPHQAFIGTYLTSDGLIYLNKQTPFETKIRGNELRLMLGVDSSNPAIKVELMKQAKNAGKPNQVVSKATGHSIYMCESNNRLDGKDNCANVSVLAY